MNPTLSSKLQAKTESDSFCLSSEKFDYFTEQEFNYLSKYENHKKIAREILLGLHPEHNLHFLISNLYYHGFDWGYVTDLEIYFDLIKEMNRHVNNYELHQLLYDAIYNNKHDSVSSSNAIKLAKKYFPPDEQIKLNKRIQQSKEANDYLFK